MKANEGQAAGTRMYAYLVETRPRVSRVRHWKCTRFASACTMVGFTLALLASVMPLWSVTQLSASPGEAATAGATATTDYLVVADGLWRRNVCFVPGTGNGGNRAEAFSDALLSRLGLSCAEASQLAACAPPDPAATLNDVEEQARREQCDRFTLAQAMQTFAVVSTLVAGLTFRFAAKRVGEMHPRPLAFVRAFATWTTVLAVYALGYVSTLMSTSYMFAGERTVEWECDSASASASADSNAPNVDVCRGPGPSFVLQHFAALCLTVAAVVGLVLSCARAPASEQEQPSTASGEVVDEEVVAVTRVPLLSGSSTNSAGPAVVVVAEEVRSA